MKRIHEFLQGNGNEIYVGGYTIRELDDGSFWLENNDGEGTQCSEAVLEKVIEELFNKVF